ncbi:MAG TPA: sulfotransferase [Acetobacteraceae bacterium]|jgi:tetratricopeptide (TPR) repeat protein
MEQSAADARLRGQAISLSPGMLQALLRECARCYRAGHLAEAEQVCRQVLASDPRHPDALHFLGLILDRAGRHAEGIELIEQAIGLRNDVPAYYNNLGNALMSARRLDEAIAHYRRALEMQPDLPQTHNNLGNALVNTGKPEEAIAHYEKALALNPNYLEVFNNLGFALQGQGRLEEAKANYQRALALNPDYAQAHNNLANALASEGQFGAALTSYDRAIALKPDYAQSHHNRGMVLRDLGDLAQAEQAYEKAIEFAPGRARYYRSLVDVRRIVTGDRYLAAMQSLEHEIGTLPPEDQAELHFALGKAYAGLQQHEVSFRHLLEGNAIKRREIVYDEPESLRLLERIATVFTASLLQRRDSAGDPSEVPVFIVGMPRSGTTLVEQILASHPAAFGAGERADIIRAAEALHGPDAAAADFPEAVPALSDDTLRRLGADYLAAVTAAAPHAARVTDKMPANFAYVGLIRLILPNARIIHVRRDPIDTCMSCFATMFAGAQPQSWDLAELGRYYRAYAALMQHWRSVLPPGVMLEVDYEDVVADVEREARRMIAYCGLDWDAACLRFHTTERPIRTASAAQVRQPIYATSVGRWRAHGDLLRPLIDALA